MSVRERIIGVGFCILFILCILNTDIISFIPFYVFPFGLFSFIGCLILIAGTGVTEGGDEDDSIDYRDVIFRLFLVAALSVVVLSLSDRTYDSKGNILRVRASHELNQSYNSFTRTVRMFGISRSTDYHWRIYDGITLLKILALGLILGGPLFAYAFHGWYLPAQRKKKKKKHPHLSEEEIKVGNLNADNFRLERALSDREKELAKNEIEIQALRAENRSLKKKLGDPS